MCRRVWPPNCSPRSAFFARNMDWGMRAAGFGTGTIGFGLALQGVKAYYGL